MSGMSGFGPWVVFRDMPRLSATNTLYVVQFRSWVGVEDRAAWAMWFLTSDAQEKLAGIARRYPDGLLKYEPGDISALRMRVPNHKYNSAATYDSAVTARLTQQTSKSLLIADSAFK